MSQAPPTVGGSASASPPLAASAYAALGDPVRLAMVGRLCASGPLSTSDLRAGAGGVSRQGVTKHLRVLEEAGLLESARAGRDRRWRLKADELATLAAQLERLSSQWDARVARLRALVEAG